MMIIGISGAEKNERNLAVLNRRAWRMEIFSSRATCTAAIRAIAPPKIDHTHRKYRKKIVKKTV